MGRLGETQQETPPHAAAPAREDRCCARETLERALEHGCDCEQDLEAALDRMGRYRAALD